MQLEYRALRVSVASAQPASGGRSARPRRPGPPAGSIGVPAAAGSPAPPSARD